MNFGLEERQVYNILLDKIEELYQEAKREELEINGRKLGMLEFVKSVWGIHSSTLRDIRRFAEGKPLNTGRSPKNRPLKVDRLKVLARELDINIEQRFVIIE